MGVERPISLKERAVRLIAAGGTAGAAYLSAGTAELPRSSANSQIKDEAIVSVENSFLERFNSEITVYGSGFVVDDSFAKGAHMEEEVSNDPSAAVESLEKRNALCPPGVELRDHPEMVYIDTPVSFRVFVPEDLTEVARMQVSLPESASLSDTPVETYASESGRLFESRVTFNEPGEFYSYVVLGNEAGWYYVCYAESPMQIVIPTTDIWFPRVEDGGEGVNWSTFDVNEDLPQDLLDQYGRDNVILGVFAPMVRVEEGLGGNKDKASTQTPWDVVTYSFNWADSPAPYYRPEDPLPPGIRPQQGWLQLGDRDISDKDPSFSGQLGRLQQFFRAPVPSRYVTFAIFSPDYVFKNGQIVSSDAPYVRAIWENFPGATRPNEAQTIVWRPNVQLTSPVPRLTLRPRPSTGSLE